MLFFFGILLNLNCNKKPVSMVQGQVKAKKSSKNVDPNKDLTIVGDDNRIVSYAPRKKEFGLVSLRFLIRDDDNSSLYWRKSSDFDIKKNPLGPSTYKSNGYRQISIQIIPNKEKEYFIEFFDRQKMQEVVASIRFRTKLGEKTTIVDSQQYYIYDVILFDRKQKLENKS